MIPMPQRRNAGGPGVGPSLDSIADIVKHKSNLKSQIDSLFHHELRRLMINIAVTWVFNASVRRPGWPSGTVGKEHGHRKLALRVTAEPFHGDCEAAMVGTEHRRSDDAGRPRRTT